MWTARVAAWRDWYPRRALYLIPLGLLAAAIVTGVVGSVTHTAWVKDCSPYLAAAAVGTLCIIGGKRTANGGSVAD